MSDTNVDPGTGTPGGSPGGEPAAGAPATPAPASGEGGKPAAEPTPATIAAGAEPGEPAAPQAKWPDNWREEFAGNKKDRLKWLNRYTTPAGLVGKIENLEKALSERATDKPRPQDPEELKAWRAEKGLPETPEGYLDKLQLPDGKVIGELDKPIAESYAKFAHDNDIPKDILAKNISWYYGHLEGLQAKQAEEDESFADQSVQSLKEEFGADYRRNINAISSLFKDVPEGLMDRLMLGRTADGRRFGDDPDVVRWLVKTAREANPAATLMPVGTDQGIKGIETRIAEIETVMRTNRREYDRSEAMQKEYLDLLSARQMLQNRAA